MTKVAGSVSAWPGVAGRRHRGGTASYRREARSALRFRLEARRAEIEQALLARVYGIADPTEVGDLTYVDGLRAAASAALDLGFSTLDSPPDRVPLVPPILLSQARLAARNGVVLDTVLRRYTAGHAVFVDFLVEQVERDGTLPPAELRRLLAVSSSAFDRLLASVSEEHGRELESQPGFSQERRGTERVERLLAGEPLDIAEIDYDLELHHVGLIGHGLEASGAIRELARALHCRLLVVSRDDATACAWLGSRRRLDPADVADALDSIDASDVGIAFGEPSKGLMGWRLTHRQATAALSVLRHGGKSPVRYAEVALLASMLQDDLLRTSLRELYLAPLDQERDGGATHRATLAAYFAADRNISSAAAALGVDRRTVANRLRAIESRLPRPLSAALPDVEAALRLSECLP